MLSRRRLFLPASGACCRLHRPPLAVVKKGQAMGSMLTPQQRGTASPPLRLVYLLQVMQT